MVPFLEFIFYRKLRMDLKLHPPIVSCRFNPAWLTEMAFSSYIVRAHNDNGAVSDSLLRETFKAVLCGRIISYQAFVGRKTRCRLQTIETELTVLKRELSHSYFEAVSDSTLKLRLEYNQILGSQVRARF